MKSTFNVLFYIRKNEVRKDGKCGIMIRVTIDGDIKQFSSKLDVDPKLWLADVGKAKGKSNEILLLNSTLDNIKASLITHYKNLCHKYEYVTADQVKAAFLGIEEKSKTLMYFVDIILEQQKKMIGIEICDFTYYRYVRGKKKIVAFLENQFQLKDIPIKEVNHDFIRNYEIYLKHNGCGHNMASKYIQVLKRSINYALSNRDIDFDPFSNFKISFKESDREFLTLTEMESMITKDFASSRLEEVRDVFIFCCFTGLAYIDAYCLTKNNLQTFDNGDIWISTKRQKTNTSSDIPLLHIPKMIIEKYEGKLSDGKLLPMKSNQKMNDYLKEIATICGINKKLSTHCARHTFATSVTLSRGVPLESISKMLGHKDLDTTRIYAKITKQKIEEDMQVLKNKEPMIRLNQIFEKAQ